MSLNSEAVNKFCQKMAELVESKKHEELNALIGSLDAGDPTEREMLIHYILSYCTDCLFTTLNNLYVTKLNKYVDQDTRLLRVFAAIYEKLQMYDLGLSITEKLIALGDETEKAWAIRTFCLNQLGRENEVIELLDKILKDHQGWEEVRWHLLISYIRTHKISEAEKELELLTQRGVQGVEDFQEHLKDWTPEKYLNHRRSIEKEAMPLYLKAIELANGNDHRGAAYRFAEAVECVPNLPLIYIAYGELLEAAGLPVESLSIYERALELEPTNAKANFAIATHCYYAADIQGAMEYCRKTLKYDPGFFPALNALGDTYCNDINDHEAAIKCYRESIAISPKQEATLIKLSYSLNQMARWADAEIALRQALKINPDSQALISLADIRKSQGMLDEAADLLKRFLLVNQNRLDAMALLGEVYASCGNDMGMNNLVMKAKQIDPYDFDSFYWKGRLLQLGDRVEAIKSYEQYLAFAENQRRPLTYLQAATQRLHDLKKGLQ